MTHSCIQPLLSHLVNSCSNSAITYYFVLMIMSALFRQASAISNSLFSCKLIRVIQAKKLLSGYMIRQNWAVCFSRFATSEKNSPWTTIVMESASNGYHPGYQLCAEPDHKSPCDVYFMTLALKSSSGRSQLRVHKYTHPQSEREFVAFLKSATSVPRKVRTD